jgi:hypothetical protein
MAIGMDYKAYVRRTGKEPNHLYTHEVKLYRKASNRKWRKRSREMIASTVNDWDSAALPPPPKTGGRLSI